MKQNFWTKIPIVTTVLVGFNICVWIFLEATGDSNDTLFMVEHGASFLPYIVYEGEWWRLFTSMFLHFGSEHLCNNMLMLGLMGPRLEHVLGSVRFGVLYVLSGLSGSLLSLYQEMRAEEFAVSAGASGAVFGVVGGLLAWALLNKGKVEGLTTRGLLVMAALSLYYGFSTAGVDNWGHIGGILGGFLLGVIFAVFSKIIDFGKGKQYTKDVESQTQNSLDGGNHED